MKIPPNLFTNKNQRQLRVAELVKEIVSDLFTKGGVKTKALSNVLLTVSNVKMSPDLKYARIFVFPLGGKNSDEIISELNESSSYINKKIAKEINLKFSPKVSFVLDKSFDYADKINRILKSDKVNQDLN
jgi:ribosome-binding factor A